MTTELVWMLSVMAWATQPEPAPSSGLQWVAPAGCPETVEVRGWLRELTEHDGEGIRARARRLHESSWVVEVLDTRASAGESTRSISGESCEAVARAAVVAVALSTSPPPTPLPPTDSTPPSQREPKPESLPSPEPAPPPPEPSPGSDPAPPPVEPSSSSPRSPVDPRLQVRLTAAGLLGYGALPTVAGGLEGSGGLQGPGWFADLGVQHWFRSFADSTRSDSAGVSISQTAATLAAGPRWVRGRFVLSVGGLVQAGVTQAVPQQAQRPRTSRRPWLAGGVRADAHLRLGRGFSLGLRVAGVAPVLRREYVLGGERVHRASPIGLESGLEVRWTLGTKKKGTGR